MFGTASFGDHPSIWTEKTVFFAILLIGLFLLMIRHCVDISNKKWGRLKKGKRKWGRVIKFVSFWGEGQIID